MIFKPYIYVKLKLSEANEELLDSILSADIKLEPRKINKPIILYGAGNLGRMAKSFFDYLKIHFLYVIDIYADKQKLDKFWQGIKIITPDEVKNIDKEKNLLIVCIVNTPLTPLRQKLLEEGWKDIVFFYDVSQAYSDYYPINNGWFFGNLEEKEKKQIQKIFFSLFDDLSRAYYLQFLAWRKLRVEFFFDDIDINTKNRFFIPEIMEVLNKNEIFVDCGAHVGFVIDKFLKIFGNNYKKIYAIEPDKNSFLKLSLKLRGFSNIEIFNCALGDKSERKRFYQGFDFVSKLDEKGDDFTDVVRIDDLHIKPTFIKMHLESGELGALNGAIKTIKKYRPIIAITIYHNSDGVYKIPFFLMNNIENYDYYIRLHSWGGTGAVFYAIPKERLLKQI